MVILRKPPDTITQSPCQGKSLFMAWYSETLSQVTSHPALPTAEHFLHTKNYGRFAAAAAKSLQSCPTLCDPTDGSPQGSPVPGILQARTLEWVAISFSDAWKWKGKVKSLSRIQLLATPWTPAHQHEWCKSYSKRPGRLIIAKTWAGYEVWFYFQVEKLACLRARNTSKTQYSRVRERGHLIIHKNSS